MQFPARAPVAGSSDLLTAQMAINEIVAGSGRTAIQQAGFQLLAILITLAIAIVGGAVTGTHSHLHILFYSISTSQRVSRGILFK